jgi:hypothetical protein
MSSWIVQTSDLSNFTICSVPQSRETNPLSPLRWEFLVICELNLLFSFCNQDPDDVFLASKQTELSHEILMSFFISLDR